VKIKALQPLSCGRPFGRDAESPARSQWKKSWPRADDRYGRYPIGLAV